MDDNSMLDCDDFEKTLKVCVVGNGNVGKTSLTTRYAKGRFTDNYKKTIGVDFMERVVSIDGEDIHLMIWDTAGQEEFDTLTSRYYRGAGAVVYVFSTVDRESFDALPLWQKKVRDECGSIVQVLVQNKIDLIDDAVMTKNEVEGMKDRLRMRLFRTSVQDNKNVDQVFEYVCRKYLDNQRDNGAAAVADIGALTAGGASPKKPKAVQKAKSSQLDDVPEPTREEPVVAKVKPPPPSSAGLEFDDISVAVPSDERQKDDRDQQEEDDDDEGDVEQENGEESGSTSGPPPIEPSKRRTNGKKKKQCVIS